LGLCVSGCEACEVRDGDWRLLLGRDETFTLVFLSLACFNLAFFAFAFRFIFVCLSVCLEYPNYGLDSLFASHPFVLLYYRFALVWRRKINADSPPTRLPTRQ